MNIELDTPHEKQKQIIQSCTDPKGKFWTLVVAGRQSGKTFTSINIALWWALNNKDVNIWYVAPTETQALEIFWAIVRKAKPIITSQKHSKGSIEVHFITGSKIQFKSAAAEDTLRGTSVNYMILDEAAFMKESVIQEIILPTLATTGRKGLIISTPKGKNWLFNWWLKADEPENNIQKFHFTSKDNPYSSKEFIENQKKNLPAEIYNQEYEASFTDQFSLFRNVEELSVIDKRLEAIAGERYFAGIDIGMLRDYTVISIVNNKGEYVYYDRFTNLEADQIVNRLAKTLSVFKPRKIFIEENNQGLPILQNLRKKFPAVEGFYTTQDSKSIIVNNLITAFSSKEIRILKDEYLKLELLAYVLTYTNMGKAKFGASSGFHDDMVMSLSLAWNAYINGGMRSGAYSIMAERNRHIDLSKVDRSNSLYFSPKRKDF